jgi:hypothetical protein
LRSTVRTDWRCAAAWSEPVGSSKGFGSVGTVVDAIALSE